MSLLQKFFDADFWKQRVKALSRDLNTTYDKLCEVTEKWRSAEKEVSDLKAEVQIAEDDFDEMANLYAGLHKAFDDLVDTNADLANKLREATLHKTANEKLQRDVIDLQQYNAAVTAEVKKLQVASAEWDSMYKGYVTATNENSRLKAENESLTKNLVEVTKRCNQLETAIENQNATIAKRNEQLRVSNNEIIALKEQCRAATVECNKRDTEYKILSEQYDKLHKVNETLTTKLGKLELERSIAYEKFSTEKDSLSKALTEAMFKNEQSERRISAFISDNAVLREEVIKTKFYNSRLENELQTVKNDLAKKDKVISDAEVKYGHDQTQAMRAISRQQDELSASIVKYVSLTDKVKVVEGIVKELMPVSMRFQTALFDLIEVPNVSGT